MAEEHTLVVDRSLQNNHFSNWRLGAQFVKHKAQLQLPGPVATPGDQDAVDYIHTRASVLHNHLLESRGQLFVCCAEPAPSHAIAVHHLSLHASAADPHGSLRQLAVLEPAAGAASSSLRPTEPRLDCSLAVVQSQAAASNSGHSSADDFDVLLSSGAGDLSLVRVRSGAPAWRTLAVYPLRPPAPMAGVRPFKVEAAYVAPGGALRCVLWGVRDRAGQKAGACEAYIATLSLQEPPADPAGTAAGATGPVPAAGELGVVGLQLVARSSLPPQSVVPSAEHDAVLLGVDPSQWDAEDNELAGGSSQQPQQQAAANGAARGAQPQGAGTAPAANGTGAGAMEEDVEHIECRRGLGAAPMEDDEDGDDIDPRTLAEAAARLAKYTSEAEVTPGSLPQDQWADIYKESAGEDRSGEAAVEFLAVRAAGQPQGAATAAGATPGEGAAGSACYWRLSAGPHKVVSSESAELCAVADDVDACVLQLGWPSADEGGASRSGSGAPAPCVMHTATIPALAYVVSGKQQRKHVLIAPPGPAGAGVSAVLVEGTKFIYLYGLVEHKGQHGLQQVVDMELAQGAGEKVMGARLLPAVAAGNAGAAEGQAAPMARLVVLTQRRVLVYCVAV